MPSPSYTITSPRSLCDPDNRTVVPNASAGMVSVAVPDVPSVVSVPVARIEIALMGFDAPPWLIRSKDEIVLNAEIGPIRWIRRVRSEVNGMTGDKRATSRKNSATLDMVYPGKKTYRQQKLQT